MHRRTGRAEAFARASPYYFLSIPNRQGFFPVRPLATWVKPLTCSARSMDTKASAATVAILPMTSGTTLRLTARKTISTGPWAAGQEPPRPSTRVTALASFLAVDPPLAAAHVVTVGGLKTAGVMAWDGSAWSNLVRVDWTVGAMATTVAPDGRTLVYHGGGAVERGSIPVPMLRRSSCVACEADLDFDGELTLFDFILFSDLFARGDLRADLDGDGFLTLKDFLAYLILFDRGCG